MLIVVYFLRVRIQLEIFPKGKEAAQKALELDSTLAEAFTSLAFAHMYFDWDFAAAERRFKEAIALKPTYVWTHEWYADLLRYTGHYEQAILEYSRTQELDPLCLISYADKSDTYCLMGQYDDAMNECEKVLSIDPDFAPGHSAMAYALLNMNKYQEAIQRYKKAIELAGDFVMAKSELGFAYAQVGDREKAEQIAKSLIDQKQREHVSSFRIAYIFMGLGDKKATLNWLEQAYEERQPLLLYLPHDQSFAPLHSEPRYQALLKKMNLPIK